MVKIKEGYVMTASEKAEYDRMNALPRKTSGRVDYYFKPQTKYPPRIYVFMDAELWRDRNRRPMGLHTAFPFLSRPMNQEEIEYHHFNWRLCYHQYEDWDKLLYAEQQEADELDKENPGTGTTFLNKLLGFRQRYSLGSACFSQSAPKPELCESAESKYFRELSLLAKSMTAKEIVGLMEAEQKGLNRPVILLLLRQYLKNKSLSEDKKVWPDKAYIQRKVEQSQMRTRRNFVRRTYHKNPLFAMQEIQLRYPDYNEAMLLNDLAVKSRTEKRKKHKPITDLRRCQLEKLSARLRSGALDEQEYHQTCCKMVMLQNAHDHRLPIPLTVTLNKQTLVYSFGWRIRENEVKSFVGLANSKGMTHEELGKKYQEMVSSNYSY
ncbi:hypothetical protein [Mucilaginibacter psychrotolerans]|uniref:Uncharacterized protein n=1 Tax=Mucilaginibacter psychrotolerans TaxID=1524096 RepID=A0A4Y8S7E8_9SPHI|nr:hypothetical protein [Mucilaginibacter psychrotolerans]TFF34541.1 hypothetical protein E2R66_21570 [Mucilaginibacter psychrotolerans]